MVTRLPEPCPKTAIRWPQNDKGVRRYCTGGMHQAEPHQAEALSSFPCNPQEGTAPTAWRTVQQPEDLACLLALPCTITKKNRELGKRCVRVYTHNEVPMYLCPRCSFRNAQQPMKSKALIAAQHYGRRSRGQSTGEQGREFLQNQGHSTVLAYGCVLMSGESNLTKQLAQMLALFRDPKITNATGSIATITIKLHEVPAQCAHSTRKVSVNTHQRRSHPVSVCAPCNRH